MRRRRVVLAGLGLAGCVVGFRGEGSFSAEHDLQGVDELRIELPSSPIIVTACDHEVPETCPPQLAYDGRWVSVGGTPADAEDNTREPSLELAREGAFAALRAVVPLSVRGLVDLRMGEIVLPDDRDLDVRAGLGDVTVVGSVASVAIDVDTGDVVVRGADAGLGVRTGFGDIDVESPGHVDLRTDDGRVTLAQTGDARDAVIDSAEGTISVDLADDANVQLRIETPDTIRIDTERITTITSGVFERRLGSGAVLVQLRTGHGDVEITQAER